MAAPNTKEFPCGYMFISYMADRQKQNIDCKIKGKFTTNFPFFLLM